MVGLLSNLRATSEKELELKVNELNNNFIFKTIKYHLGLLWGGFRQYLKAPIFCNKKVKHGIYILKKMLWSSATSIILLLSLYLPFIKMEKTIDILIRRSHYEKALLSHMLDVLH